MFVMLITCISIVMTVAVLNCHYQDPLQARVPSWMEWLVLNKIRNLIRMEFTNPTQSSAVLILSNRNRYLETKQLKDESDLWISSPETTMPTESVALVEMSPESEICKSFGETIEDTQIWKYRKPEKCECRNN